VSIHYCVCRRLKRNQLLELAAKLLLEKMTRMYVLLRPYLITTTVTFTRNSRHLQDDDDDDDEDDTDESDDE
jgi:hypothetical protein